MTLKSELMEIDGIGPSKSEQIIDVVESHDENDVALEAVEKALDYFDQGDYGYGEKYLRRLVD